jgi:hypothetical protein
MKEKIEEQKAEGKERNSNLRVTNKSDAEGRKSITVADKESKSARRKPCLTMQR